MLKDTADNLSIGPFRHVINMDGELILQRCSDGAFILGGLNSGEHRGYLRWLEKGNTPEILDYRVPSDVAKVTAREAAEAAARKVNNG